jgi:hypothetical protein
LKNLILAVRFSTIINIVENLPGKFYPWRTAAGLDLGHLIICQYHIYFPMLDDSLARNEFGTTQKRAFILPPIVFWLIIPKKRDH